MYFLQKTSSSPKIVYFDLPRANQKISYSGDVLVTAKRVSYSSFSSYNSIFFCAHQIKAPQSGWTLREDLFFQQTSSDIQNAYFHLSRANQKLSYSGDVLVTAKRVSHPSFSLYNSITFNLATASEAAKVLSKHDVFFSENFVGPKDCPF